MNPVTNSQWQEGPEPPRPPRFEPYRPNDTFARVLAAKQALEAKMWPKRGR